MGKGHLRVALATLLIIASLPLLAHPAGAAGCGTPGVPTRTIYLPNITKTLGGPSGWYTPFIVQNVGVAPTDLEVSFYRFSDGALVTCRRVSALAPFRSFADVPNNDVDLTDDSQFAVVVRSFGADVIAVVNEHQGAGPTAEALSYVGLTSGAQQLSLPYVAKLASGWLTTFVVQNLGSAPANVSARFVSLDGTKTATLTRVIAPGASRFVNPIAEPSLIAGAEYAVTITADQPVAAIANAHNDAPGTAAPMGFSYNAIASVAPDVMYVPSVTRNADGGRNTRLVIENGGATDAAPTLTFRRPGTAPVTAQGPQIGAGHSWSFDTRLQPDGATPCPVAGTASCIGEGDWALTVSGGQFAVLDIGTTATSALGTIGAAAPGNRAYLPNVTRTLGGANGWTTPIVVQSAGATSAALRWYRFSDGALMTRQLVTGLSAGAAVRVDPRTVPGLTDDTQYAVVVDAQGGTIAAAVLELSFQGGDGAMAYEGFRATVSTTPVPTFITTSVAKTFVYTGARVQASALVKDQFDNVMSAPVTWSTAPATLGAISANGLFSAAEGATGVVTITATAGAAASSVQVTIAQRPLTSLGGISFALDGTGLADVYTEPAISGADASAIEGEVDVDVARVEADFQQAYASRPRLYFLASSGGYAAALQSIFHYDATAAQELATTTDGLYLPDVNVVLVDWSKVRSVQPLSTARHELTHMMEFQVAGGADLPAWLNEGSARLEELTVPGSGYIGMNVTYASASMATTGTLLSFSDMTSQAVWNVRPGLGGEYQYYEAAEAVRELRARVGGSGYLQILELLGTGVPLADAYGFVAGEPFTDFVAGFSARLQSLSAIYPAIVTAPDSPGGPGMSILFYGFRPGSVLSYTISGAGSRASNLVTVSRYGTYFTYLASDWGTGAFTITAQDGNIIVSIGAVKTSSTGVSFVP